MVLAFPNLAATYRYYANKFIQVFSPGNVGVNLTMDFLNPQSVFELDFLDPKGTFLLDFLDPKGVILMDWTHLEPKDVS